MTVSASLSGNRYGNPVFDCSGARLRAQSRRLATVVTISGEIDAVNIDRVTQHARRFVLAATSVVLDLSGVRGVAERGLELLRAIDQDCGDAGVDWALVPSSAVLRLLSVSDDRYPIAASVRGALNYFADETLQRRSTLLPLLIKSA